MTGALILLGLAALLLNLAHVACVAVNERVGERLKPPDCKSGPQGALVQIQPRSP